MTTHLFYSDKANHTIGKYNFINHVFITSDEDVIADLGNYVAKTPHCGIRGKELTDEDITGLQAAALPARSQGINQGVLSFNNPGTGTANTGLDADLGQLAQTLQQQAAAAAAPAPKLTKA